MPQLNIVKTKNDMEVKCKDVLPTLTLITQILLHL